MMVWIAAIFWLLLLLACLPAVYRVMAGKALEHDILGFSFAWVAIVMLGFSGRWIFAAASMVLLDAMRGAGCLLAVFLFIVTRFYRKWG